MNWNLNVVGCPDGVRGTEGVIVISIISSFGVVVTFMESRVQVRRRMVGAIALITMDSVGSTISIAQLSVSTVIYIIAIVNVLCAEPVPNGNANQNPINAIRLMEYDLITTLGGAPLSAGPTPPKVRPLPPLITGQGCRPTWTAVMSHRPLNAWQVKCANSLPPPPAPSGAWAMVRLGMARLPSQALLANAFILYYLIVQFTMVMGYIRRASGVGSMTAARLAIAVAIPRVSTARDSIADGPRIFILLFFIDLDV